MESGSREQEEARGRAPCATALVPWGAHSGGRAQGGPSGNITRGGPAPSCRKRDLPAAGGGWRQESSEGAEVSPTTSGVGEAEFNGGKQVRESKTSPTEPGGRRSHWVTVNKGATLPFFTGRAGTGVGELQSTPHTKSARRPSSQAPSPASAEDASRPNSNHPPPRRPTCSFPSPPPPPQLCGGREQRWQSDRPRALLCHPGSLGLDSLDGPPALSLGHCTTLGSSHPCPTRVPPPVPGRR